MEITLNGKISQKKEEREGGPESPLGSLQNREEGPEGKKKQEKEEFLRREEKVEMGRIDSDGISETYGNERQAKYFGHLRPGRVGFLIKAYTITRMNQDNEYQRGLSSGKWIHLCLDGVGKMG